MEGGLDMLRAATRVALALLLAGAVALPSTASARPDRSRELQRATARARIVDFSFRPRRIEVDRGTRVRWTNQGQVSHTTTSTTGVWDSGTLAPGGAFSREFKRSGTFRFACTIHPSMTGRVVVT
jgi:plastocyanin